MMKKYFLSLISLIVISTSVFSQTFEMRTFLNSYDYIAVQMRQTDLGTQTDPLSNTDNDFIWDLTFAIKWLPSIGEVNIDVICTNYNIVTSGVRGSKEGFHFQQFNANDVFVSPDDFVLNEWVTIATIQTTINTGSNDGTFELAENNWAGNLMVQIDWDNANSPTYYLPTPILGACDNTPVPTTIYDHVWTGADATNPTWWDKNTNWEDPCGTTVSAVPTSSNNCIIPIVSTYPTGYMLIAANGQPTCNTLRINSGVSFALPSVDTYGNAQLTYSVSNDLTVYGQLTLSPNAQITVSGDTYIDAAEGIIVQADATGVGSFIDNGITYGGSGTAKVQTFLTGSGTPGTFDFHCVGPTVDITGTGVTLSEFNVVPGQTYAYKYNEPTDTWVNFDAITDPVPTAKGIGLSTNDGSTNTMEMTGKLKTGPVSSEAMTIDLNGSYLLSNPYPSSVYWDDIFLSNTDVNDKVYVYDGANYQNYNTNTGGTNGFTGYLQVGQGFFVEAIGASPFTFANSDRHHSNSAFYKSDFTNRLDVRVSGNESTDGLLVHFYEGAISGYEANEDVAKKMSYRETATQFWTVLDNGQQMSINAMPLELLGKGMQSVPMSFVCGATGEYMMSLLDAETFETGTEIWLEDKQVGGDWVSVNDNPDYVFTATPDDLEDRFVIHFFGPTGVNEIGIENTIDIYSYRQHAFVRNNTNEVIKQVNIYTLAGELLQNNETVDLKLSKFWVSNNMGYYVVRVITDKNVYTNKVFISK